MIAGYPFRVALPSIYDQSLLREGQRMTYTDARGTGPGEISPDGSAVEFYAQRPPNRTVAALIHSAIPPDATVLDLGAGAGNVTHPLLDLGHQVVAVDMSAGMLAQIRGARTVQADIVTLDLGERFDAVLLMSFLLNYGDRDGLLRACRRHVADDGLVIIQRESDEFHAKAAPSEWSRDGIDFRMHDVSRPAPGVLHATIDYTVGEDTWSHTFISHLVPDADLPAALAAADLTFDRYLNNDPTWALARPAP